MFGIEPADIGSVLIADTWYSVSDRSFVVERHDEVTNYAFNHTVSQTYTSTSGAAGAQPRRHTSTSHYRMAGPITAIQAVRCQLRD
jgi:hypothetical protein